MGEVTMSRGQGLPTQVIILETYKKGFISTNKPLFAKDSGTRFLRQVNYISSQQFHDVGYFQVVTFTISMATRKMLIAVALMAMLVCAMAGKDGVKGSNGKAKGQGGGLEKEKKCGLKCNACRDDASREDFDSTFDTFGECVKSCQDEDDKFYYFCSPAPAEP